MKTVNVRSPDVDEVWRHGTDCYYSLPEYATYSFWYCDGQVMRSLSVPVSRLLSKHLGQYPGRFVDDLCEAITNPFGGRTIPLKDVADGAGYWHLVHDNLYALIRECATNQLDTLDRCVGGIKRQLEALKAKYNC